MKAYTQLDPDEAGGVVAQTCAARTRLTSFWLDGEAQRRGLTLAWSPALFWLERRVGDTERVPTNPFVRRPTAGRIWPLD